MYIITIASFLKKKLEHGSIAQLGEHLICIQGVESSSLFRSTKSLIPPLQEVVSYFWSQLLYCYTLLMTQK